MDVVVLVKSIRTNEIGNGIMNQEVLHCFWLLYKANIRIFLQNGKMGKSFRIRGNARVLGTPYLCARNKNDQRYGSV